MTKDQTVESPVAAGRCTGTQAITVSVGRLRDVVPLVNLSESVYGFLPDGSSEGYYRWQYEENPSGPAIVGNAECGGELIGHYAVIPRPVWLDGQERVVGLGVNALTKREFEGRGIFARLVARVEEAAGRQGILGTYVVPSPQSKPWFVHMFHFTEWSPIGLRLCLLRCAPFLRSLGQWGRLGGGIADIVDIALTPVLRALWARGNPYCLEMRMVSEFGPEFDRLWEEARAQFRFSTVRRCEHLRWRYGAAPTRHYETWGAYSHGRLVSYVTVRVRNLRRCPGVKVGVIADLFGTADAVGLSGARLLVGRALQWMAQQDVSICMMQLISPAFEGAVRGNAFFRLRGVSSEQRALLFRFLDPEQTVVPDRGGMHFVGGDHDMG